MPLNVNVFNREILLDNSDYASYVLALSSDLPNLAPYAITTQLSSYLPLSGGTLTGPLTAQNIIAGNTTVTGLTARGPIALVGSISGVNGWVSFNTSLVQGDGSFGAGSSTVASPNAAAFGLDTYAGSEGGYAAGSQTSVGYGITYSNLVFPGGGSNWRITYTGSSNFFDNTDVGSRIVVVITDGPGGNATPEFITCRISSIFSSNQIDVLRIKGGGFLSSNQGYIVHNKAGGAGPGAFGATAFGFQTVAIGDGSFSTGMLTAASGLRAVAMGYQTKAYGDQSMALGNNTIARANNSVAVGFATVAAGDQSYAEGNDTRAFGNNCHTEGYQTSAFGNESHAESFRTRAGAFASHAEGIESEADGIASHAAGYKATAAQNYTYAWSDGNLGSSTINLSTTRTGQYMVSASGGIFFPGNVGIGTDNNSNALTVVGLISTANYGTSLDWNSTYTTVYDNSASWGVGGSPTDLGEVPVLSANWNSTYTTVYNNSASWGGGSPTDLGEVPVLSANWNSTYTTVNTNSARYTTIDYLSTNNVLLSAVTTNQFIANTEFVVADTGTSRIFTASDNGRCITFSNTSPVTASVPAGLPVGFNALLIQINTGQVFVSAGAGVTINSDGGKQKIATQHSSASLISYAADVYNFSGNITT